jgi:hypothetical protein
MPLIIKRDLLPIKNIIFVTKISPILIVWEENSFYPKFKMSADQFAVGLAIILKKVHI